MAIELAPGWKQSLTLDHPTLLVTQRWDVADVGAIVTPPLTLRARRGAPPPRVIEFPGGFMMRTGAANPGVNRFLQEHQRAWAGSATPIIVALAAQAAGDWAECAARLARVESIAGIELHLNLVVDAAEAIRQTRAATDLPILAKLDLENARAIADACLTAGANALVIGRAPRGARMIAGRLWHGRMYGAFVKPIVLRALDEIAALNLGAPLVACGGVHSADDAREFLAAGACAVEVDTAHWVEEIGIGEWRLEVGS